ncbi:flagellar protein FliS [Qipengyuania nanhaisediminis]|uniref:flagellar protein FliS n=1 Tax=Qipengyuania nanhaisediminis TaxID=604088 RepID=UPI0038B23F7E
MEHVELMQMLARKPADIYRRVDLEARIEASSGEDLTRICLEEAVADIGRALVALERSADAVPGEPIARAQAIALYLARGVDPGNPLHGALTRFYGGLAGTLARNIARPDPGQLAQVRSDLADLLAAARAA